MYSNYKQKFPYTQNFLSFSNPTTTDNGNAIMAAILSLFSVFMLTVSVFDYINPPIVKLTLIVTQLWHYPLYTAHHLVLIAFYD